ncbi:serine/threonine protein kinase [Brasilonema octagenarum UFV-E1]|uniref:non-specific serine/threonine protein kinase n=1 Tax=Brasilonema sennae CENA114 TaxID=415709 RepID=A0A856MM73_9CYAN|nr:serine/threonine-protein kinase [Brasilonema sennae]QDL10026.1 serine/threonine protein kinase [Brasilonema sennae CENA114]QDL16379.1 serine/threonine protein kinase [Brasilonema octagenarum UFV-E1]
MTWAPGQKLHRDKYEIKRELGRGRIGITYLATNRDGKETVIKTLNPDLLNQLSLEDRNYLESGLLDEAPKLARCKHPNIVLMIESFKEGDLPCIVMEYIQGDNLANIIRTRGFFPEKEALGYIQQIGQALIEVHKQGFLHRDIKPENIMVRAGTYQAVLIDFDLARGFDSPLTSRGARVDGFTPIELYSNSTRQQARRGAWTDIYSLAATLYVLLTGQQPVSAIDRKDQNKRLAEPKELNNKISDRINNAIIQGMELEPEQRRQTVEDWLKELGLQTRGFSLPKLLWIKPLWARIIGILTVLGLLAGIISGLDATINLRDKLFPKPSATPTNSTTQDTTPSLSLPQKK